MNPHRFTSFRSPPSPTHSPFLLIPQSTVTERQSQWQNLPNKHKFSPIFVGHDTDIFLPIPTLGKVLYTLYFIYMYVHIFLFFSFFLIQKISLRVNVCVWFNGCVITPWTWEFMASRFFISVLYGFSGKCEHNTKKEQE